MRRADRRRAAVPRTRLLRRRFGFRTPRRCRGGRGVRIGARAQAREVVEVPGVLRRLVPRLRARGSRGGVEGAFAVDALGGRRAEVGVPGSGERRTLLGGVHVGAVVHLHRLLRVVTLLDHLPERLLDVPERRGLVRGRGAEEVVAKLFAVRLEVVHRERLARVEPDVLGVVRRRDAVGAEPVPGGDLVDGRGEAVHVVPARTRGGGRRKRGGRRRERGGRETKKSSPGRGPSQILPSREPSSSERASAAAPDRRWPKSPA